MAINRVGNFGYTAYADIDDKHYRVNVNEILIIDDESHTARVLNQTVDIDITPQDDGGDDEGDPM